jgi:hypothetical protein
LKYILLSLIILSTIFYYSCDDAGTLPTEVKAGAISFSQIRNLRVLNVANDGSYYLWIQLTDSVGAPRWRILLGNFNVGSTGALVDPGGNPVTPLLSELDTLDLGRATTCLITIESAPVTQPGIVRLLGGTFTVTSDSIYTSLRFNDPLALGSVGDTLLRQGTSRLYIINTPTNGGNSCEKGIWYCDTLGNSYLPDIPLNPNGGWQFRGWIYDRTANVYTTTGAFFNPRAQDFDGAGGCSGSDPLTYNAPGQDFITGSCGNINLLDGFHEAFIVIEPNGRPDNLPPFNLRVYYQPNIVPSLNCRRIDNIFGQYQNIPEAKIRITR